LRAETGELQALACYNPSEKTSSDLTGAWIKAPSYMLLKTCANCLISWISVSRLGTVEARPIFQGVLVISFATKRELSWTHIVSFFDASSRDL
jgi:hypothetical protein